MATITRLLRWAGFILVGGFALLGAVSVLGRSLQVN
jgi:hypothetical protein